jgi:hypothetical protein
MTPPIMVERWQATTTQARDARRPSPSGSVHGGYLKAVVRDSAATARERETALENTLRSK